MTVTEEKVREFANKLLNKIDDLRYKSFNEPISILAFVRNYLIGLTDGIDLDEEMRKLDKRIMKFKLVEYPYGREIGFKQDIVWFIQGTDDNKTWNNYVWRNSPAIVYEKESYHCPPISAYLTIEEANEAFDKIIDYYKKQTDEKPISIIREVEI